MHFKRTLFTDEELREAEFYHSLRIQFRIDAGMLRLALRMTINGHRYWCAVTTSEPVDHGPEFPKWGRLMYLDGVTKNSLPSV